MAVNLTNADSALKTYYLDVISEQLNKKINPLFSMIKSSTENVYGKEVRCFTTYGVNGGFAAGTEDGNLPQAEGNNYAQMVSTLKNFYGTIEISDKAIRASESNSGAFVNLLNAEMEGLINSSALNFARMIYGDGSGFLARINNQLDGTIYVDNVGPFFEGMHVEFFDYETGETLPNIGCRKVLGVDKKTSALYLSGSKLGSADFDLGTGLRLRGSAGNELTGLGAIFSKSETLYGLSRAENAWLKPIDVQAITLTEKILQTTLDAVEMESGEAPNIILCAHGVRRKLLQIFKENNTFIQSVNLECGVKALSYNGIPIVADRFCPEGTMYILNTNDFVIHQLCDWQWMEGDDGRILKQVAGKPVYTATLVKYAELMCKKPKGQARIFDIIEEF